MENPVFDIVLAYNQPITIAGLTSFLSGKSRYSISGQVNSADQLFDRLAVGKPDLIITDYAASGFTLDDLAHVLDEWKDINVLIVSSDEDQGSVLRAFKMGIKGFVTRDCSREELLLAVEATVKGEKFFTGKILNMILNQHAASGRAEEFGVLTTRETEILRLLAQGQSTQKIADKLFLSPHTVQTHRKSIIRKLKIKSPTQFVIFALDMGLIKQK